MAQTMIVTDTRGLQAGGDKSANNLRPGRRHSGFFDRADEAGAGTGTPSLFQVYPEAPHAFFADYRPSNREAAAKDDWQRLTDWLKQHGVA